MDRVNELLAELKAAVKEQSREENNKIVKILAVIGVIASIAAIAYLLYRFLQPDYYEDYDDDVYDDEYEAVPDADVDDAPESDEEPVEVPPTTVAEGAPVAEESDFAE